MANKIQLRRDTSSNWSSGNPTLSQGELGHETNTGKLKVGDGSTTWNSLGYVDTTYTSSNFTHDDLTGFVANEHIDWTADQGSTNIHAGNYTNTTYTHPNHTGEVTSTADGATVISDNVVDEANLKVSNSPTNGYVLTAQSGNTGGLTWAAASGGGGDPDLYRDNASSATTPVASGANGVAIGSGSVSSGAAGPVAVGIDAEATGHAGNAFGTNALATAVRGTALTYSRASGTDSFAAAIGNNAATYGAKHTNSVAIGHFATTDATSQVALGSNTGQVKISGAYTLPTSDGSANYVLTTNGSGVANWAAASGGGGGADLYAANPSSATDPTASGSNSVAIGDDAVASGVASLAFGQQTDATGTNAIAIGSGAQATQPHAVAIRGTASARESTAIGVNNVANGAVAAGEGSMALQGSYASGSDSFAAGIANNTSSYGASGTYSSAIGQNAKATGYGSKAWGFSAVASDTNATAIGAYAAASGSNSIALSSGFNTSTASGYGSVALGVTTATATYSVAIGHKSKSSINGKLAYSGEAFATHGDGQGGQFILLADTTDATATVLTTNNSSAGSTNQIVANSDTCIMFSGTLVAMQNGAQDQGGWEIKGLLKNDGGTTTLVSSNIQTFDDGNGWVVALTADNTNNALAVTCTGEASHNIRWVANIQTSEVTYA